MRRGGGGVYRFVILCFCVHVFVTTLCCVVFSLIFFLLLQPEPTTWASRRPKDSHTQEGDNGGSIEYLVELCNVLGANPWVNMPHAADDGYVTSFANYVKNNLRPDLKVGTWHTAKERTSM
jgi:hypothetical protein